MNFWPAALILSKMQPPLPSALTCGAGVHVKCQRGARHKMLVLSVLSDWRDKTFSSSHLSKSDVHGEHQTHHSQLKQCQILVAPPKLSTCHGPDLQDNTVTVTQSWWDIKQVNSYWNKMLSGCYIVKQAGW